MVAFEDSGGIPALLRRHDAGLVVPMADTAAMAARALRQAVRRGAGTTAARARRREAIAREHDFGAYAWQVLTRVQPALPVVSVVVPSYNYARYLPARLASIFTQTHPVAEIIVLDDASTDGSAAQARSTAVQWDREIRLIENARNTGSVFRQWLRAAEEARGTWLWIAEADDESDPAFLAQLMRARHGRAGRRPRLLRQPLHRCGRPADPGELSRLLRRECRPGRLVA